MNFVLHLQGDLDLKAASLLQQTLLEWVERTAIPPQSYWIIDLAEVNAIDRSGLSLLAQLCRLAAKKKCHLRLCNLKLPVRSMLEMSELNQKFKTWEQTNSPWLADFRELWVSEVFGKLRKRLMAVEKLRGGEAAIGRYALKGAERRRDRCYQML